MLAKNNYFEEINFDFKNRIIFLDVDGTLVPDRGVHFGDAETRQLEKLKKNNQVFLCTNSNDKIRNSQIEKKLGLLIANYRHKKPSAKILKELRINSGSENLLVIGDKYLTDGIFAKNIRAEFIKVKRKVSGHESLLIKLINLIDDLAWKITA